MNLGRFIDGFLPPSLREGTTSDGRRARIAVGTLLAAVLATVILGGTRLLRSEPAPLLIPVLGGLAGLLVLIRTTGNVAWLAHGASLLLTASITGLTLLAGGVGSVAMSTYAVVPLVGVFLGGMRTGVLWTAVACGAVLGFKLMEAYGVPWPIEAHPERTYPTLGTLLFIWGAFALAWAYDFARGRDERLRAIREAELAAVLDAFPDLVARLSPGGACEEVHAGHTASPLPPDAIGHTFASFFVDTDAVREAVRRGVKKETEIEARSAEPPQSWKLRFVPYEGGGVLALARDVTGTRAMEAELAEARLRASLERADRMSSIGLLAAGMAHEVNNPLAYLSANLAFVEQQLQTRDGQGRGDAAVMGAVTDAQDAVERIRRVVADLKLYARPEEELASDIEACRPQDIVSAALKLAHNELQHRATVYVDHRDPPAILGSEARLVQVLLNLLVNSAQAIPPGSASEHRVEVSTGAEDSRVWIRVRDTGPGIPEDILGKITQPFFTTKPVGVGTGLGLSVCEGIVAQLDGSLEIQSVVGEGTTVTVRLPAAEKLSQRADEPSQRVPQEAEAGRILIVDDEPLVRRALRRLLRGHEIVEAESGAQAQEVLSSDTAFDVILCDVMMPDVTGIELYQRIRDEAPALADRFVFMTGGAFDERIQELFAEVEQPVVQKPFRSEVLRRVIAPRIGSAR